MLPKVFDRVVVREFCELLFVNVNLENIGKNVRVMLRRLQIDGQSTLYSMKRLLITNAIFELRK